MKLPDLRTERSETRRGAVFLSICLVLVYGIAVIRQFRGFDFALYDPGWFVSVVMSIVEDHDLDLRNQLRNDPSQAADQTSQGKNGEWYPLHEILMPVLTVPFYLAFGIYGCLIFNVLVLILFMLLVFRLCARHVDRHTAFTATVLTAFPTLFLNFAYSYSVDVFSAFLLVLAYWCAVENRALLAGFVWGLAVYSRLANAVTIVGFGFYFLLSANPPVNAEKPGSARRLFLNRGYSLFVYLAGGLPVGVCFLFTNWAMFGSPMTTSYDRWQHFVDGRAVVTSQRGAFSCPLLERLLTALTNPQSGLLIGAPLLILAVAFGARIFWKRARNEAVLQVLVFISLVVLFSKYCNAVPGSGNRYLMPVVALSAIPLSLAVEQCFRRFPST